MKSVTWIVIVIELSTKLYKLYFKAEPPKAEKFINFVKRKGEKR